MTAPSSTACTAISIGRAETGMRFGSAASGAMRMTAAACEAVTCRSVGQKEAPSTSARASAAIAPAVAAPASVASAKRMPARSDASAKRRLATPSSATTTATSAAFAAPKASASGSGLPLTAFAIAVMTSTIPTAAGRRDAGCSIAKSTESPAAGHHSATEVPGGVSCTPSAAAAKIAAGASTHAHQGSTGRQPVSRSP